VDVKFPNENEVPKYIEDPRFRQLNEIGNGHFEVTMAKKKINLDLPIQIGYFVYCYAKLRMLEFYYDFIDKFVDRKNYEYCEMDTDSAYIALSGPTLESVIKPNMLDQFYEEREQWLPSDYCPTHKTDFQISQQTGQSWFKTKPDSDDFCADCLTRKNFTKRSPGLFKVEWQGKGIVALCSKTFYAFGTSDKISAKAIIKHQNDLTPEKFLNVLLKRKADKGINYGFRPMHNKMHTYTQSRDALSYLYIKRQICDDNVSTRPLHI
jgi:hypothetical protein